MFRPMIQPGDLVMVLDEAGSFKVLNSDVDGFGFSRKVNADSTTWIPGGTLGIVMSELLHDGVTERVLVFTPEDCGWLLKNKLRVTLKP